MFARLASSAVALCNRRSLGAVYAQTRSPAIDPSSAPKGGVRNAGDSRPDALAMGQAAC